MANDLDITKSIANAYLQMKQPQEEVAAEEVVAEEEVVVEEEAPEQVDEATKKEEKKLDPVGSEDGDVDNDGDEDAADKYLKMRRKKISKAIAKEEVELDEANSSRTSERFQSAEAELAAYAKKSGGVDKKDFMDVAKMLGQIGRLNILQSGQVLARLNRKLSDMDTDPRDKVYSILKAKGLMETLVKEVEEPRAKGEKDFKDKHTVDKADLTPK